MNRIRSLLAAILVSAVIGASAHAQSFDGEIGAGHFLGNPSAAQATATDASGTAMFDRAFCSTANAALARISGSWVCLATANNAVWATSGAGVPSLTQTLPSAVQDNITRLGSIANVGAPIGAPFGGTGQSSYAVGDILYAPTSSTVGKLADVATGNAVISGGVGVVPSYGKIGLGTHVSGQLPLANGGCNGTTAATCLNNIMPTPTRAGDIVYWNGSTFVSLAGNNSGTNVLTENASGVPSWAAPGTGTVTNIATAGLASGGAITTTGTITVTAASKSDQTTGTSNTVAVTPLHQQDHASATKAWARFNGGGATVIAGYNVSSITRTGAGNYLVNFTTAFSSSTAYACVTNADSSGGANYFTELGAYNAGNVQLFVFTPGLVLSDTGVHIICTGSQ